VCTLIVHDSRQAEMSVLCILSLCHNSGSCYSCCLSVDLPGLNKVARKLNVDCPAAMVGWDFHGGVNHPVFVENTII